MYVFGIPLALVLFFNSYLIYILLGFIGLAIFARYKGQLLDYVLALFIATGFSEIFKYFINTARPEPLLPELTFEGGGFPSTHTTLAFTALFFYLFACQGLSPFKKRAGKRRHAKNRVGEGQETYATDIFLVILAVGVGLFRVISRAHFITDILAGILIGLAISLMFTYYDVSAKRRR